MIDLDKYMTAAKVALDGARATYEKHTATDATAEAMCSFIEQRMTEHGFAVNVRYEWQYPAAHRILERLGFVPVIAVVRELHFVLTPREGLDVAFVHVVSL